jgi:hypothetical protein
MTLVVDEVAPPQISMASEGGSGPLVRTFHLKQTTAGRSIDVSSPLDCRSAPAHGLCGVRRFHVCDLRAPVQHPCPSLAIGPD